MNPLIKDSAKLDLNNRVRRTIEVLPILLAMVFHAIAMQRWLLVAPALLAIAYATLRSSTVTLMERSTSRQWYVIVIAGFLVGMVMPASDAPSGMLPPAAAATLTGIAVAVCLYTAFTHRLTIGWISAWALVAISGKNHLGTDLRMALLGFLVASLVAASLHAGVLRRQMREMVIWGVFGRSRCSIDTRRIHADCQRRQAIY